MKPKAKVSTHDSVPYSEEFKLNDHPFYLFGLIVLHRVREVNRALSRFNFDHQKWRVAAILNDNPNCTMQALAERTGVDRTTLAHTVQLMIDAKLITKSVQEADRRSISLALSEKGRKALQAILPTMIEINKRGFSGFSDREMNLFMDQLRRILNDLKDGARPKLLGIDEESGESGRHKSLATAKKPRISARKTKQSSNR